MYLMCACVFCGFVCVNVLLFMSLFNILCDGFLYFCVPISVLCLKAKYILDNYCHI